MDGKQSEVACHKVYSHQFRGTIHNIQDQNKKVEKESVAREIVNVVFKDKKTCTIQSRDYSGFFLF